MESSSSSSIKSLDSVTRDATELILLYYQDLLAAKSIFQMCEPVIFNDKLIELNVKLTADADFSELCEMTDIVNSVSIPQKKLRQGEEYSLRAAVGVRQIEEIIQAISENRYQRTIIYFNGSDPARSLQPSFSSILGGFIWINSSKISPNIFSMSQIYNDLKSEIKESRLRDELKDKKIRDMQKSLKAEKKARREEREERERERERRVLAEWESKTRVKEEAKKREEVEKELKEEKKSTKIFQKIAENEMNKREEEKKKHEEEKKKHEEEKKKFEDKEKKYQELLEEQAKKMQEMQKLIEQMNKAALDSTNVLFPNFK